MTTIRKFPHLSGAFGRDAWDWLQDNAPEYADALRAEVESGATPEQIRAFARHETDGNRGPFVTRLRQAAGYLAAQREAAQ